MLGALVPLVVRWWISHRLSLDPTSQRSWRRCGTPSGTDVAYYIDTSALVKLVVAEAETEAFRSWLAQGQRQPVACDLVRTELLRAVRRAAPDRLVRAREVLDALALTDVRTAVFEEAGRLQPVELRSLDALHLAAALDLGDDLEAIVTYDERLAAAAEANGIPAISPA
ncbi:MAG: type II toxin-antitoxin system VapC family toxin [Acidimicrobiia bacterium]|nr:type II toxin-antitoxin system VapC family toxin [Acidimicrobiia bacterium]